MRPHISLDVRDVPTAVEFYKKVFEVAPQKQTVDYAKFDLAAPTLNLSLVSSTGRVSSVDHLGIEVDSVEEIAAWKQRLQAAGILERVEENQACCFARQDKLWFTDPDGNAWEVFTVHEQLPVEGSLKSTGCCVPKHKGSAEAASCAGVLCGVMSDGSNRSRIERVLMDDITVIWRDVLAKLRGFIAKRVTDEAEVDDILQETFLRMHRKLDSLKDPKKLLSWIYQITRHAIIDHYRAPTRTREVAIGLSGDIDSARLSSAISTRREDSGRLREELAGCLRPMIAQLARQYREAVTLVELDGVTQQAAAKQLGLSVSGMKSRVQRGRRQLKRMLQDCCLIQLDQRRSVMGYAVRKSGCAPCGEDRGLGRDSVRRAGLTRPR